MADVTEGATNKDQHSEVSSSEPDICSNGESKSGLSKNSKSTPLSSRTFVLNPARLSNPFAKKVLEKTFDDSAIKKDETKNEQITAEPTNCNAAKIEGKDGIAASKVSFVPLCGEPTTATSSTSSSSSLSQHASTSPLGFVFGQNIHEKVETSAPAENTVVDGNEASPSSTETPSVTTNGTTTEMLFSSGVKKEIQSDKVMDSGGKSLSEAAREYEEARAVKRKFEAVQVITGEEEESNVLQINCKLFSWSSCSWVERGRGTLRVNDLPTNPPSHRLIVRAAGSLRLVLNTKIWSGMTVDRASVKSIRITGMDSNGVVKVFLLMASPKEMDQLQKCLEWRVNNLKKSEDNSSPKKSKNEEVEENS
ncbi:ran-binding protein 3 isoform X1 [Rhodnius prolixus]|uniref:RanBD1 domain-containing protein n=1 Tax=Rhodnius prolixus TaxID=13249 RepID=A0ABL0EK15_RHOPR